MIPTIEEYYPYEVAAPFKSGFMVWLRDQGMGDAGGDQWMTHFNGRRFEVRFRDKTKASLFELSQHDAPSA